jgi:cytochrome P450
VQHVALVSVRRALFGVVPGTVDFDLVDAPMERLARHAIMHPLHRHARAALDDVRAAVTALTPRQPCALAELHRIDARMPDPVCVDNLVMMARIGTDNVAGLLRWMVVLTGEHPPGPDAEADVFDAYVMETLRLAQSEYVYRRAVSAFDLDGYRVPKGWRLRVCVAESHRDPAVFPEPGHFTTRFVGRRPGTDEYCPFGMGAHACNAAGLSMMIARSLLIEIARSPRLVVYRDGRVVRAARHWSHWRPAPPVGVMLRAQEAATRAASRTRAE